MWSLDTTLHDKRSPRNAQITHWLPEVTAVTFKRFGAAVPPAAAEDKIVNDASFELLARTSVSRARSGVDIISPSDEIGGEIRSQRLP
ncbi:MAG: hypothetical protein ACLPXM_09265 [Terriglobales bacterium]